METAGLETENKKGLKYQCFNGFSAPILKSDPQFDIKWEKTYFCLRR